MTGAKKQYNGRDKDIYEYLETHDVYNPPKWPKFDLRGYAKYLEEKGSDGTDINPKEAERFLLK